jgi:hypothetical protein
MKCRRTRATCLERELAAIPVELHHDAERHLAECEDCAAWAASSHSLTEDLASLYVEAPIEIDVTARVMDEIRDELPVAVDVVPARQLGWAAAAAVACVVLVLSALVPFAPEMGSLARDGWSVASGLARAAGSALAAPAESAVTASAGVAGNLLGSLTAVAGELTGLEPIAATVIGVFFLLMSTTIALVVGRDFRGPAWTESRSRTTASG